MGNFWHNLVRRFRTPEEIRLAMIGLDAAGKTTILYRLIFDEFRKDMPPTIGFNVETIAYNNMNITFWDVGGRSKSLALTFVLQELCKTLTYENVRPLYKQYFENLQVLLMVVDSTDRDRIPEMKEEVWCLLPEVGDAVLLVMANKQDLPNAMSVQEVTEILELHKIQDREWYIQGTSAMSGQGLQEGLQWVQQTLSRREVKKAVMKPVKEVAATILPGQTETRKH